MKTRQLRKIYKVKTVPQMTVSIEANVFSVNIYCCDNHNPISRILDKAVHVK